MVDTKSRAFNCLATSRASGLRRRSAVQCEHGTVRLKHTPLQRTQTSALQNRGIPSSRAHSTAHDRNISSQNCRALQGNTCKQTIPNMAITSLMTPNTCASTMPVSENTVHIRTLHSELTHAFTPAKASFRCRVHIPQCSADGALTPGARTMSIMLVPSPMPRTSCTAHRHTFTYAATQYSLTVHPVTVKSTARTAAHMARLKEQLGQDSTLPGFLILVLHNLQKGIVVTVRLKSGPPLHVPHTLPHDSKHTSSNQASPSDARLLRCLRMVEVLARCIVMPRLRNITHTTHNYGHCNGFHAAGTHTERGKQSQWIPVESGPR